MSTTATVTFLDGLTGNAPLSRLRRSIPHPNPVEPGPGDYFLFHYTNEMKNLSLGDGKFKQDWPKSVTRVKPRG